MSTPYYVMQVQCVVQVLTSTPTGTDGPPADLGSPDAVQEQGRGAEGHLGAQDTHGVPD